MYISSSLNFLFWQEKSRKKSILLVFQYKDYAIRPELSRPPRFRIQGG